jgi:hypothetical protein
MMTDYMGEISRAQLDYASNAGKRRSCTKPWIDETIALHAG